MPEDSPLHLPTIENLRSLGTGDDFLHEIIPIYLQDTAVQLKLLERAQDGHIDQTLIRATHTIKGSSSNVGAEQVRACAAALEQRLQQGPPFAPNEIPDALRQLTDAFQRASTALNQLIAKDPV